MLGDGDLVGDGEAEAFQAEEFFGAVGEEPKFAQAQVAEDLGTDAEIAPVQSLFEEWRGGVAEWLESREPVEAEKKEATERGVAVQDDESASRYWKNRRDFADVCLDVHKQYQARSSS